MAISFLVRGFVIGFSVAAIVGPVSILCIHRTLHHNFLYGFVTGLGAATADALYGSVAGFGLTVVSTFLVRQQMWIHIIGGMFLLYLGIRTALMKPAKDKDVAKVQTSGFLGAYSSTLLLTLTNPTTILSFVAIFAGLGIGSADGAKNSVFLALLVVAGVFSGSTTWWLVLCGSVTVLRARFTARWLLWINRGSGCVITAFALLALLSIRLS